jgi:hypothetical protein
MGKGMDTHWLLLLLLLLLLLVLVPVKCQHTRFLRGSDWIQWTMLLIAALGKGKGKGWVQTISLWGL